jgi:hypothetical protein
MTKLNPAKRASDVESGPRNPWSSRLIAPAQLDVSLSFHTAHDKFHRAEPWLQLLG